MKALRKAVALGLVTASMLPAAAYAAPTPKPHAMTPAISPQAGATMQKAFAAMAGASSGRADLTIAGSPLATHLTFTRTPLAADIQTTIGKTPFTDSVAIDGMLYQRLGNGTYGATRITNLVSLFQAFALMQIAMLPKSKHAVVYDPKNTVAMPIRPISANERDTTEDGIAVAQLSMDMYYGTTTTAVGKAQPKPPGHVTMRCTFARTSGLPHRCSIALGKTTFATLGFSGWNDPANIVTAPAGVPTPPPDAQPMITPMPTMLPTVAPSPGAAA